MPSAWRFCKLLILLVSGCSVAELHGQYPYEGNAIYPTLHVFFRTITEIDPWRSVPKTRDLPMAVAYNPLEEDIIVDVDCDNVSFVDISIPARKQQYFLLDDDDRVCKMSWKYAPDTK